jgi:fumarate reductase flavoprotein subunit
MTYPESGIRQSLNARLVIIGAGGAGLSAALAAAEKGISDIVVIEKRGIMGGTSSRANGIFACESPVQVRERVIADRDPIFKKALEWAHWKGVDPRLLRTFIDKSGDTIRWLESFGLEFNLIRLYPEQQPPVQHNVKGYGAHLIQVLAQKCAEMGVKILLNSPVEKIISDPTGSVSGVWAVINGEKTEINSKTVLIATGGFSGNPELLRKYCPAYYEGVSLSGVLLNGDGIMMAAAAGAELDDRATLIVEGPRFDPYAWPFMALERDPSTLWVNRHGCRFVDETSGYHVFESVYAMLRQPDRVCFTLLDSSILQYLGGNGIMLSRRPSIDDNLADRIQELENALQAYSEKASIKIAGSWDEIAAWMTADAATLKKTITEYNSFCDKGYDGLFAKERKYLRPLLQAPFYAIKSVPIILDTIGVIKINEKMEVLNKYRIPIPGLYAAGVVASGWQSEIYCGVLSAGAFGFAVNSGRIAGESVVQYYSE